MLTIFTECRKFKTNNCSLCSRKLIDTISLRDICQNAFYYECLWNYAEDRLQKNEPVKCQHCQQFFDRIDNRYKNSEHVLYQNFIHSSDKCQCSNCFSEFRIPVASPDTCSHDFCPKKCFTIKYKYSMGRRPIKLLVVSEFVNGHINQKITTWHNEATTEI